MGGENVIVRLRAPSARSSVPATGLPSPPGEG